MTKILMLLQSEFPPDIRLEKEIKSLFQNGFEVTLLCNQFVKGKVLEFPYCKIIHLKAVFNSVRLNKILNFPLFLNPRFIYYLFKVYLRTKPNYIHAHDLPMVPLALLLKLIFNKPVIFDMHENYPEALKAFQKKGIANFLFKNYRLAKFLEDFCIKKSDKIISVVDENKTRLLNLGITEEKIVVVSNTVDLETFNLTNKVIEKFSASTGKFVILYSGTVSPERGLITAVKSIKILREKVPNVLMQIIGDGKSVVTLQKIIDENEFSEFVELIPWVGHEKIPLYISKANICMIPQPSNDFIDTTIPHKLFEYMSLDKTVLVSDAKPFKRIVEETNCGLVFESNNPIDFANKVIEISQSNINYGANGKKAVEKKYNWAIDAKILIDLYKELK